VDGDGRTDERATDAIPQDGTKAAAIIANPIPMPAAKKTSDENFARRSAGQIFAMGKAGRTSGEGQMARNLVDAVDGFLVGKRYVLIDREPLYTDASRRILGQGGVKAVRLPARSPNVNTFGERFVLSIKSECLERMVPLGETHLRRAVAEYMLHYHLERNHQGLGKG
jgi:Integrase core domain